MENGFCLYPESVRAGFRFPLHSFTAHLLLYLGVAPSQLAPNSWRSIVGFLAACALVKIAPSRQFLGRSPSSIHGWKRSFCFVHSSEGWSFPTSWAAVNPNDAAFRSPADMSDTELSDFESLQGVILPDLINPSPELFALIREDNRAEERDTEDYAVLAAQRFDAGGGRRKKRIIRDPRPSDEADVQIVEPSTAVLPAASPSAPVAALSLPARAPLPRPGKQVRPSDSVPIDGGSSSVAPPTGHSTPASPIAAEPSLREWVHWTDHTLEATEGRLRAAEEKVAILKSKNAELEASVAAMTARADQSNELAARLAKGGALAAEKVAREAEEQAHEQTKVKFSELVAEERRKAVMEYRRSDAHIDQITGIFKDGYNHCLKALSRAYPDLDLSPVRPPSDDSDVEDAGAELPVRSGTVDPVRGSADAPADTPVAP
ncbi:hypothetical protein Taro_020206 [Colocasia esculenta]|uniref:Transposase (putative) gypsy type domain-containing protein n=1 Tax=Colocasia esculenta TaxID=4460 RepID=A0A843UVU7_COLES|nr:hypothetical protein [Colocasia esculenta]